uniref:Uncharacterized protein n=1 Tax=Zea mays TaxID=4577 RepID=A0A804LR92_MAIZE
MGGGDERDLGVRFPDQRPRLECIAFYVDPTKHYPFTCTSPCELLGKALGSPDRPHVVFSLARVLLAALTPPVQEQGSGVAKKLCLIFAVT